METTLPLRERKGQIWRLFHLGEGRLMEGIGAFSFSFLRTGHRAHRAHGYKAIPDIRSILWRIQMRPCIVIMLGYKAIPLLRPNFIAHNCWPYKREALYSQVCSLAQLCLAAAQSLSVRHPLHPFCNVPPKLKKLHREEDKSVRKICTVNNVIYVSAFGFNPEMEMISSSS